MPYKILIADHEPAVLASLAPVLSGAGYTVAVARDGNEVLALASSFIPDVVLLDVQMHSANRFELCEVLRADTALSGLLIVMLSARGCDAEVARGLAIGADAYLIKPVAGKELLTCLRDLLIRHQ